jgi:hypothetical protein
MELATRNRFGVDRQFYDQTWEFADVPYDVTT